MKEQDLWRTALIQGETRAVLCHGDLFMTTRGGGGGLGCWWVKNNFDHGCWLPERTKAGGIKPTQQLLTGVGSLDRGVLGRVPDKPAPAPSLLPHTHTHTHTHTHAHAHTSCEWAGAFDSIRLNLVPLNAAQADARLSTVSVRPVLCMDHVLAAQHGPECLPRNRVETGFPTVRFPGEGFKL